MTTEMPPWHTVCHCGEPLTIRVTLGPVRYGDHLVFEVHLDHQALADHHAIHEEELRCTP